MTLFNCIKNKFCGSTYKPHKVTDNEFYQVKDRHTRLMKECIEEDMNLKYPTSSGNVLDLSPQEMEEILSEYYQIKAEKNLRLSWLYIKDKINKERYSN